MNILEDMDDWMFGGARRNRQRVEETHEDNRKRIQSLLDSDSARALWYKARAAAEGDVDPYVEGAEDLGKIRAAKDKFSEDEISPETAAYFTAAEKSVLDRMKQVTTDNRAREFVGPPAPRRAGKEMETSKSAAEYFQPVERNLRLEGQLPAVDRLSSGMPISDYFQAPTETVPEGNIPKTYPQLGITNIDDQATLQEMQDAMPDVDMKSEYEADPEMMKKLMELWRAKKLTKKNLHKAFSMIQQTAQQALGLG